MNGKIMDSRPDPNKSTSENSSSSLSEFSVSLINYSNSLGEYDNLERWIMTRNKETEDFVFAPATESFKGMSSFDDFPPWKDIKKCILSPEGEVLCYEGEPEYTVTPDVGDVMVEIPKFWYGIEVDDTDETNQKITFHISNVEKEGYYVSPRHEKWGSMTKDYDKIYVSAYLCNSSGRSISGTEYTTNKTLYVQASRGDVPGFYQYDLLTLFTIELLRLVESGNMSILNMADIKQYNAMAYSSGLTDTLPYHTGKRTNSSWKYRGMENLCDNWWYYTNGSTGSYFSSVILQGACFIGKNVCVSHDPAFILNHADEAKNSTLTVDMFDWHYEMPYDHYRFNNGYAFSISNQKKFLKENNENKYQNWTSFFPSEINDNAESYACTPYGGRKTKSHYVDEKYSAMITGDYRSLFHYDIDNLIHQNSTAASLCKTKSRLIYLPPEK